MADSSTDQGSDTEYGFKKLKEHVLLHKIDFALWLTRVFSVLLTIGYFIPIFWNPYTLYYKTLLSNASTSALRLHQRLPQVSLTKQFLHQLLLEDSCHYLFYSIIFLYIAPITLALQPIFLFSLLHFASYSLTLLDCLGQNSWWGARLLISLVEIQSRNLLKLISVTEIILMPFTVILLLLGYASLFTPLLYYQFLCLRYASRRNPYTRNLFHELRIVLEKTANKPGIPQFIRQAILTIVSVGCKLAPAVHIQES
ncbi:hypothetical protein RUM44_007801 [Polyplax serrata]|uniref:Krueppel homolog 2 n=1 Tax=Polyplax serrata TaxID=468196 RepID=A0ABR1B792_POLSC